MFNRFSATSSSLSTPAPTGSNSNFFGQPQQQPNSSVPAQTTSPFGNPFSAPAPISSVSLAVPVTPFSITNEIENGVSVKLLSICAMPAYRHLSQEEIRIDDYLKGRKGPSSFPGSNPGAFSQPFSSNSSINNSSGFGSFGSSSTTAPAASGSFGGFGSTLNPPSQFGGGNSFGLANNTNSGAFGTLNKTGSFGTVPSSGGFGSFGSSSTAQPSSTGGFGGFGSTSGTGVFGNSNSTISTPNNPTVNTSNIFGGFGQVQAQPSTSQPFGATNQPSSGMFGAKPSTGIFGSTPITSTAPSAPAFGSSGFGNSFGQSSSTIQQTPQSNPSNFSTGFGQAQPAQAQQLSGFGSSGMFGSTSGNNTSSGLFSQQTSSVPSSGFGINQSTPFGSTTGAFNIHQPLQQQQSQPQQQQQSNFFGGSTAPTSTSTTTTNNLFRPANSSFSVPSATTPLPVNTSSTNLFPSSSSSGLAQNSTGITSGMFNRPANTTGTTGLFGGSSLNQPLGSTSFSLQPSSNISNQIQPQPFQTSAAQSQLPLVQPASSGSLSLFPPLPSIFTKPSESSSKPVISAAPKSPVKFTPRTSFRIKPREAYNLTTPIPINFGTGPISSSSSATTNLVPRKMMTGAIPNIKKLVIPDFNDIHDTQSFTIIPSTPKSNNQGGFSSLSPAVNMASFSVTPSASSNILTDSMSFGQQYTFPPLKILKSMTNRSEIKNFVIGQKGIGEVRFLVPVDLSEIDPDQLFGHYIEFSEGEALMYPDPAISKPEPGQGLNWPAQVRLERIWTMSKGSRDPIVDPQSEKVIHFKQKLKETEGTNFVSYEPSTGTWTFTVDNF